MSIWKIAWRSIQQRALSSFLTAFSMALGVALIVAVLVIHGVVSQSFARNAAGYDLIVTSKGGKLEAVLSTVFHLGVAGEPLPYTYYEEFLNTPEKKGKFAKHVAIAIPYCMGDSYEGFRVIGTTPEMFNKFEYAQGKEYKFSAGENYKQEDYFGAVIGSLVARRTGLTVGSKFEPTHGVTEGEDAHKHDPFVVRGVLEPTGTPNDRAIFVNMEGFYLLDGHAKEAPAKPKADAHDHAHDEAGTAHDHDEAAHDHEAEGHEGHDHAAENVSAPSAEDAHAHEHDEAAHDHDHAAESTPATPAAGHDHDAHDHDAHSHDAHGHDHGHAHAHTPLPKEQREVSAILIRTSHLMGGMSLMKPINEGTDAQAVQPQLQIAMLFAGLVGNIQVLLLALAVLVILVAGIGIMVSMYNSMSDRRREIGIMRALGAPRRTIVLVILVESLLLAVGGGIAGFVLGHAMIGGMSPWIADQTGVQIGLFDLAAPVDVAPFLGNFGEGRKLPVPVELFLIGGLAILAQLVGILPAMAAYRTDVSRALCSAP
jgi:putative ABC transport system permease protein